MAKLIDAEELKKKITGETIMKEWGKVLVNTVIEHQPAVDAVEVVRCKDCIHRDDGKCPMEDNNPWYETDDNDFCSYGERRRPDAQT